MRLVVIGATSDIGMAIARHLSAAGADLALVGRDAHRLSLLRDTLKGKSDIFVCDLLDSDARTNVLKEVVEAGSRLSGMIYVAGYHRLAPVASTNEELLNAHIAINMLSPFELIRNFVSRSVSDESKQRSITIVSSIAHRVGEPALSIYSATKGAMVSGVRSLAVELARKNIRVNTVSPGWITGSTGARVEANISLETKNGIANHYPLGLGDPGDVAAAVEYLVSPGAKWITGVDLVVDGGRTCV